MFETDPPCGFVHRRLFPLRGFVYDVLDSTLFLWKGLSYTGLDSYTTFEACLVVKKQTHRTMGDSAVSTPL